MVGRQGLELSHLLIGVRLTKQKGGRAFFLSAILLLPLRLSDTQTRSKTLFYSQRLAPTPSLFLIRKMDEAAKFWDIRKGATGGFPDRHKKRAGWLLPGEKKTHGVRGLIAAL